MHKDFNLHPLENTILYIIVKNRVTVASFFLEFVYLLFHFLTEKGLGDTRKLNLAHFNLKKLTQLDDMLNQN
jgi:hypothetical protein